MAKKRAVDRKGKAEGITIVTYDSRPAPAAGGGRLAADVTLEGGTFFGWFERRATVSPEKLQSNLKSFLQSMEKAMAGIPQLLAGYSLEEIELSLEVGAEGEIGLLGTGGKLSGKGSISLKLTRPKAPAR
jgi:hypothetical protein